MRGPQFLNRRDHVFEVAQTSLLQPGWVGAEGLEVYLELACELVLFSGDEELCGCIDFSLKDIYLLLLLLVVVLLVVTIVAVSIIVVPVSVSVLPPSLFVPGAVPVVVAGWEADYLCWSLRSLRSRE